MNKTTYTDAINTMLSAIGEPPISNINSQRADAKIAIRALDEVLRDVQSYGWYWNTEHNITLTPDVNGKITVDGAVARLDTYGGGVVAVSLRGNDLYNVTDSSYVFSSQLLVTWVVMLAWDQLPEEARRYCMVRAARIYQDRIVGSEKHHTFNQQDEFVALARLRSLEMDTADYNILANGIPRMIAGRNNDSPNSRLY